ncbi:MAG TPA: methyltransferase domain-containing protein [Candidatus Rifleibacterium sp.]|nr:methyltransferase domain-containing protein [Candidatus Rifleibacterium sp.]HPT46785.1 methyltransferase domain-containing protein [Candidatus Rifleibacterium sp.]
MSIATIFKEMRSIDVRSTEKEFMDDPEFKGVDLTESFRFIKITNMLGGGRLAVINCISKALQDASSQREISVLDVGCGIGDMGRAITGWGERHDRNISYTGLEKSGYILDEARRQNKSNNIRFISGDLFANDLPEADLVMISMVLHHLDEADVICAIKNLAAKARIALIISELERSLPPYLICRFLSLAMKNSSAVHDALLSVRKGFKACEMSNLISRAGHQGIVRRGLGWRILAVVPTART